MSEATKPAPPRLEDLMDDEILAMDEDRLRALCLCIQAAEREAKLKLAEDLLAGAVALLRAHREGWL